MAVANSLTSRQLPDRICRGMVTDARWPRQSVTRNGHQYKLIPVELTMPLLARANRAFLQYAVRHLVDAGVRQFLDLGSGIPTAGNVHDSE